MCNNQNCRRMKTTLLVVGRTVEQHYITAINDYIQRTKRSITFDMEVIPELKNTKSLSMEVQKEKEGELILKALQPDRKSTRLNSSHTDSSRMPSSA